MTTQPDTPRRRGTSYLVAVAAVLAAAVVRSLFDPYLGYHLPFVTFFIAVAVAAWLGGLRPALLATVLGFLLAKFLFVPPRFSLFGTQGPHLFGLAMYFMVCLAFAAFGETMRRALLQAKLGREKLRTTLARKAAMLQAALDCIVSIDHEGNIIEFNPAAERLFGYRSEDVVGREMAALIIPPALREQHRQGLAHYLATGEGPVLGKRLEITAMRSDGTEFPVELSITRIVTPGTPLFTGYLRDISERVRLEGDLRQRAEELDAANRGKTDFIAVLCHELRSPLNAMSGWAEVLKRPSMSEDDRQKGLEVIARNIRIQAQLIADLLDVNRIATGKLSLELRTVDLREEIERAIDAALPAAEEKQIRVESDGGTAPAFIRGDSTRLQQVLGNLLSNAIKFTPGGGEIRLAVRQVDARAEVTVSDTGQGISLEALPHIFERFRQGGSVASDVSGGLGLGLAVSKQLVELHGGDVSARSPGQGKGATFTISFPLVSKASPAVAAREGPENSPVSLGGFMVLVVDDEPDAREPVRRILEEHGAEVVTVRSADEALEAIKQQRPDVLVSDIGMPGRDGYDLIRAVRALPPGLGNRIPAIALTAFGTTEDRERALRAGYMTHLAKPVDRAELIAAVAALIPSPRGAG